MLAALGGHRERAEDRQHGLGSVDRTANQEARERIPHHARSTASTRPGAKSKEAAVLLSPAAASWRADEDRQPRHRRWASAPVRKRTTGDARLSDASRGRERDARTGGSAARVEHRTITEFEHARALRTRRAQPERGLDVEVRSLSVYDAFTA